MKLAYFSPMPPDKTGIATYSQQLVKALRGLCDVTVFTPTADAAPIDGVRIVDFVRHPGVLKDLRAFDQALYHLGNNPWFHCDIRDALRLFPGVACLHDTVLYYLAAGSGRGTLLRELLLEDATSAFASLREIEAASVEGNLLRYPTPSRHPCIRGILEDSRHVVVHNETSAAALRTRGYAGRIDVVPLLHFADEYPPPSAAEVVRMRSSLHYESSHFVLGAFGFIGPTKRMDKVLEALARLRQQGLARQLRLLVVGEGEPLDAAIADLGIEDMVQRLGFVNDEDFRRYMGAVDLVVNLRYPSHGESSASLIQAMSYGKACVVTDHGFFAEMPDDTVAKIAYDAGEVDELVRRIAALARDPAPHRDLGEAAARFISTVHDPRSVARRLLAGLEATARGPSAEFEPAEYLRVRLDSAIPRMRQSRTDAPTYT